MAEITRAKIINNQIVETVSDVVNLVNNDLPLSLKNDNWKLVKKGTDQTVQSYQNAVTDIYLDNGVPKMRRIGVDKYDNLTDYRNELLEYNERSKQQYTNDVKNDDKFIKASLGLLSDSELQTYKDNYSAKMQQFETDKNTINGITTLTGIKDLYG